MSAVENFIRYSLSNLFNSNSIGRLSSEQSALNGLLSDLINSKYLGKRDDYLHYEVPMCLLHILNISKNVVNCSALPIASYDLSTHKWTVSKCLDYIARNCNFSSTNSQMPIVYEVEINEKLYEVSKGFIREKNGDVLFLSTCEFLTTEDSKYEECHFYDLGLLNFYINSKVLKSTDPFSKFIIKKLVPYITTKDSDNWSFMNRYIDKVKVIISTFSANGFIHQVYIPRNISNLSEDINNFLIDNIDKI